LGLALAKSEVRTVGFIVLVEFFQNGASKWLHALAIAIVARGNIDGVAMAMREMARFVQSQMDASVSRLQLRTTQLGPDEVYRFGKVVDRYKWINDVDMRGPLVVSLVIQSAEAVNISTETCIWYQTQCGLV
jgi:hypothetical protein